MFTPFFWRFNARKYTMQCIDVPTDVTYLQACSLPACEKNDTGGLRKRPLKPQCLPLSEAVSQALIAFP